MKTKNIFRIAFLAFIMIIANACVDNNDYSLPDVNVEEPDVTVTNTLRSIKDAYPGFGVVDFSEVNNGGEMVFEGYVVSSDEAGNMYKVLNIQDKPEDPTAAIQIAVDATDLYTFYEVGRKVYVKLLGLAMHENNGVLEIGQINGSDVERISVTAYKEHILRSSEVATIVPRELASINDINENHISMLIQLQDIQTQEKGQTYANLEDTFSVNRIVKSCADDATIIMRNSGFSDFKAESMPETKGTLTGVVGAYRNDLQLFIRDTRDLDFTGNRCDPLFEENFSANNFDQWIIQDVEGDEAWEIVTFGNPAPSAKISGFNRGPQDNEDWLISKAIDLSNVSGDIVFTFDSVKRYSGLDIEVYYSTNYNGGDPNDTANTWTKLNPTLDTNTGSWSSWTDSGEQDVSAAAGGDLFIAFKYVSSGVGAATFEIDNVRVVAK